MANIDPDELVLDDPDSDLDGTPIPKDDRVVPATVESVTHDNLGVAHENENVDPYVWVKAHHNLPGFEQPVPEDSEPGTRPRGLRIGEQGWMPNDEEGVRAVELGFAEIVEPPHGAVMPKGKTRT